MTPSVNLPLTEEMMDWYGLQAALAAEEFAELHRLRARAHPHPRPHPRYDLQAALAAEELHRALTSRGRLFTMPLLTEGLGGGSRRGRAWQLRNRPVSPRLLPASRTSTRCGRLPGA